MQDEMDKEVRYVFALLLTERECCDDADATSGAFKHNVVDEFLATRMRFIHVKVCCVFAQRLGSAYHHLPIQIRQDFRLEQLPVAFLLCILCVSYWHTGHP